MNERTENLPILQDFVPYRAAARPPPMKSKEKVEQGKGSADHLMPLGYLFLIASMFSEYDASFSDFYQCIALI